MAKLTKIMVLNIIYTPVIQTAFDRSDKLRRAQGHLEKIRTDYIKQEFNTENIDHLIEKVQSSYEKYQATTSKYISQWKSGLHKFFKGYMTSSKTSDVLIYVEDVSDTILKLMVVDGTVESREFSFAKEWFQIWDFSLEEITKEEFTELALNKTEDYINSLNDYVKPFKGEEIDTSCFQIPNCLGMTLWDIEARLLSVKTDLEWNSSYMHQLEKIKQDSVKLFPSMLHPVSEKSTNVDLWEKCQGRFFRSRLVFKTKYEGDEILLFPYQMYTKEGSNPMANVKFLACNMSSIKVILFERTRDLLDYNFDEHLKEITKEEFIEEVKKCIVKSFKYLKNGSK